MVIGSLVILSSMYLGMALEANVECTPEVVKGKVYISLTNISKSPVLVSRWRFNFILKAFDAKGNEVSNEKGWRDNTNLIIPDGSAWVLMEPEDCLRSRENLYTDHDTIKDLSGIERNEIEVSDYILPHTEPSWAARIPGLERAKFKCKPYIRRNNSRSHLSAEPPPWIKANWYVSQALIRFIPFVRSFSAMEQFGSRTGI